MATRELRILCGIPGVGKSTWANHLCDYLDEDGFVTAIVSRDFIRFKTLDENNSSDYFAYEDEVFKAFIDEINTTLQLGIDYIFVDATHINPNSRMKVLSKLTIDESTKIIFDVFDYDIKTAISRNSNRSGREKVPDEAIRKMWRNFKAPNEIEIMNIKSKLHLRNKFAIYQH